MAKFLALIRKSDFIDLFKYGSFHINKDLIREFTCDVKDLPGKRAIFDDIFYFANNFDSTFTYLFIYYEKTSGRPNDIDIADVKGLYPLDQEAKISLTTSLDPRIRINDPLWPEAIYEKKKEQTIQNCKNGVSSIWKMYKIDEPIENTSHIINDSILREFVDELYEGRRPSGKLPIWVYLMRYERHAFYPSNTIGAFMDAVNAIFNYKAERDVDSSEIESLMIMSFLRSCNEKNPRMNFDDLYLELSLHTEMKIQNFTNYAKEIVPGLDILKIAALYFIYKDRYKEVFKYEEKWILKGKYVIEFPIVSYMLGCFLGYEHTYDCLYDFLPLAIFKQPENKLIVEESPKTNIKEDNQPTDNTSNSGRQSKSDNLFNTVINQISSLFKKDGTPLPEPVILKENPRKKKTIVVYTKEDLSEYLRRGYIIVTAKTSKKSNKK